MKSASQKDREKQKLHWQTHKRLKEALAAYELPAIPNPEVTKKKVSERV